MVTEAVAEQAAAGARGAGGRRATSTCGARRPADALAELPGPVRRGADVPRRRLPRAGRRARAARAPPAAPTCCSPRPSAPTRARRRGGVRGCARRAPARRRRGRAGRHRLQRPVRAGRRRHGGAPAGAGAARAGHAGHDRDGRAAGARGGGPAAGRRRRAGGRRVAGCSRRGCSSARWRRPGPTWSPSPLADPRCGGSSWSWRATPPRCQPNLSGVAAQTRVALSHGDRRPSRAVRTASQRAPAGGVAAAPVSGGGRGPGSRPRRAGARSCSVAMCGAQVPSARSTRCQGRSWPSSARIRPTSRAERACPARGRHLAVASTSRPAGSPARPRAPAPRLVVHRSIRAEERADRGRRPRRGCSR